MNTVRSINKHSAPCCALDILCETPRARLTPSGVDVTVLMAGRLAHFLKLWRATCG